MPMPMRGKSVLARVLNLLMHTNGGTTPALAKGTTGIESASMAERATVAQPEALGIMRPGAGMRWHHERCQLSAAGLLQTVLRLRGGKCMVDLTPRKGEPEVNVPLQGNTKKGGLAGSEVVVSKRARKNRNMSKVAKADREAEYICTSGQGRHS